MAEEEETETSPEAEPKKKSGSLVLIIIIVILFLIIIIGAVVAILLIGGDSGETTQQQQTAPKQVNERSAAPQKRSVDFENVGPMFPLDAFTVNLLSENGRRYLKVEMNLELSGEELGAELEGKKAVIRDVIIRLLSSKSLEEISTSKGKEKLKDQIVEQLNMRLRDGSIKNVYFTEFVVQ